MPGALYRKYRPQKFADVIDQRHITVTIENSIKNGTFAHAYLLTGPRGVGKTTVARLFAYGVNGLNYAEEQTYSDVIEIDAASNRRIDEIRELREKINIAPSILKFKVYIIDEVHMLTREAFNALLKTLEEPPAHAIFILATTDFHKVPDTIISRCVRFSFSSITHESTYKHLSDIAKKEKIDIENDALKIIADNADGSFRDAISLLDQFRGSGQPIRANYVAQVLGLSPEKSIENLFAAVESGQPKEVVHQLLEIRQSGSNDAVLAKQLINHLRGALAGERQTELSMNKIVELSEKLLSINDYIDTELAIELALIEASLSQSEQTPEPSEKKEKILTKIAKSDIDEPPKTHEKVKTEPFESDEELWQTVLEKLKKNNATLYSVARMAEPKYSGNVLELHFKFPFHYKQMSMERNLLQINDIVKSMDKSISGVKIELQKNNKATSKATEQPLKNISNIFGSAEVIES